MKSLRALFAIALVLVAILPGCLSGKPKPTPNEATESVLTITNPVNFPNEQVANDSRPHVHDYWNGLRAIVVFEESVQVSGSKTLRLRPGFTVYPGTLWVNLTATWSPSPIQESLVLYYKTANDTTMRNVPMMSGRNVSLVTSDESNDLPHSRISQWNFTLGGGNVATPPSVHVVIQISRDDRPLRPAPPHPDGWNGRMNVTLFDHQGPLFDFGGPTVSLGPASTPQRRPPSDLTPTTLIPPFASTVYLNFSYNSSSPMRPYSPVLFWHGADSYYDSHTAPSAVRANWISWKLELGPEKWDSPYANHTAWSVYVSWLGDSGVEPAFLNGDFRLWMEIRRSTSPPNA